MTEVLDTNKIAKAISERYYNVSITEDDRILDAIMMAIGGKNSYGALRDVMLEHFIMIIHRFFNFKKIAIVIKTAEGFEYRKIIGFDKGEKGLKITNRSLEQIKQIQTEGGYSPKTNVRIIISNENEKNRRDNCEHDECVRSGHTYESLSDDDVVYVYMLAGHREIKGWIELASPRDEKLPSRRTLYWISLIGDMMVTFV